MSGSRDYDAAFFAADRPIVESSARRLVPLVLGMTGCRSVVDVGCGTGTWLRVFAEHGVADVLGLDGNAVDGAAIEIAPDRLLRRDLTEPFALDRQFDLAMSLEVAEHLPEAAAAPFIASLAALAPVVLFSAAVPHQGGRNHVNEQWPAYWAARFAAHGFVPADPFRRRFWEDPAVAWWYAQNLLVYVDRERLALYPELRREHEYCGGVALPLVHPHRYLEWIEWGLSQCGAS